MYMQITHRYFSRHVRSYVITARSTVSQQKIIFEFSLSFLAESVNVLALLLAFILQMAMFVYEDGYAEVRTACISYTS